MSVFSGKTDPIPAIIHKGANRPNFPVFLRKMAVRTGQKGTFPQKAWVFRKFAKCFPSANPNLYFYSVYPYKNNPTGCPVGLSG